MYKDSELDDIFTYHAPTEGQPKMYENIRATALRLASLINTVCPDCREKSVAITNIQQAVMWANAAIAIHDKPGNIKRPGEY